MLSEAALAIKMKLKMSSIEEATNDKQQARIKDAEFLPDNTNKNNVGMNKIESKNVHCWYGDFHVLRNVNMEIKANTVTALIGPSGCGKSTFLRSLKRMNDLIEKQINYNTPQLIYNEWHPSRTAGDYFKIIRNIINNR